MASFDPQKNYYQTRDEIGYIPLSEATLNDYKRIGFKSGLEVHQQLKTKSKLFCRCPAGIFHDDNDYDAEVIRHMRPTLSEMGVYDGTALMEFKTRKEITYRINNRTACTYEVDDTPPFPLDPEALKIALRIALTAGMNIVGEVHITRKQYLDGSIPTGFQRSAIISVEGELKLSNKKIRLIQMSLEEDSCREISDIGHKRIYKTDRLGMPLIETVTYPDCLTPFELAEAAEHIRFLNRSTGMVRTGMGAAREDVNVSCEGGNRAEIKGVAHIKWIPELSHNEAFRQFALLNIRRKLKAVLPDHTQWNIEKREITEAENSLHCSEVRKYLDNGLKVWAVNLPGCRGILSHFTQPGLTFADEISDRLKVIACIEKPNMIHSEEIGGSDFDDLFKKIAAYLSAEDNDAQIILRGPEEDIPTAIETIEERFRMAFEGVPNETRKAFADGRTMFERVLPGRDRMYPDTDSQPIAITTEMIDQLGRDLPKEIPLRLRQLKEWKVPQDTWFYLLSKNLLPLIEKIIADTHFTPAEICKLIGHRFKNLEGRGKKCREFRSDTLYDLFVFISNSGLQPQIARKMLPAVIAVPDPDFSRILVETGYSRTTLSELKSELGMLSKEFALISRKNRNGASARWIMGQLHSKALGNVRMSDLREVITEFQDDSKQK